ncbi:MAG: hypothetical protein ACPL1H_09930 [bacterium]
MLKKTKKDKKPVLKKEHFEILLENIDDKLKVVSEGYTLLNNKIDNFYNDLHKEINDTRQELIFLIKATVDKAEGRLNKRIDDVIVQLTKKIEDGDNAVVAQLTKKIEDGDRAIMEHVDHRFDETNQKIDEINNILKTHSDKLDEHEERISRIEQKG